MNHLLLTVQIVCAVNAKLVLADWAELFWVANDTFARAQEDQP